jgi:cysteinyl-tRNA synthetase
MSRMPFALCALALILLNLSGCKTPRPALDEANNGAALTVSLAGEIKEFRRAEARIAQARLNSVRRLRVRLAKYEAEGNFDERVLRAADKTEALRLYTALRDLSDSRAQDEKQLQDKIASIDAAFAKLLEPLPEATRDLTATQKALAVLGEELSTRERIATTAAFVKEIRKTAEENRKIKEAEAANSAAAAPAAPETPTAQP